MGTLFNNMQVSTNIQLTTDISVIPNKVYKLDIEGKELHVSFLHSKRYIIVYVQVGNSYRTPWYCNDKPLLPQVKDSELVHEIRMKDIIQGIVKTETLANQMEDESLVESLKPINFIGANDPIYRSVVECICAGFRYSEVKTMCEAEGYYLPEEQFTAFVLVINTQIKLDM